MWSEELIKPEFMWGQIFPRLAAVAERAYKEVNSFFMNLLNYKRHRGNLSTMDHRGMPLKVMTLLLISIIFDTP